MSNLTQQLPASLPCTRSTTKSMRGLCIVAICATASMVHGAQAQVRHWNNTDLSVGGTAEFTAPPTGDIVSKPSLTLQSDAGLLVELQEHPYTWAGFGVQYRYGHSLVLDPKNRTVTPPSHEATGSFLIHAHSPYLQPFVEVGGGGIYVDNAKSIKDALLPAGLVQLGMDVPIFGPHFGIRLSGRALEIYNYSTVNQAAKWQLQVEPASALYLRF